MVNYADLPFSFTCVFKLNLQSFRRQFGPQSFGPFHKTDAVSMEVLVKTKFCGIIDTTESVEIEMVKLEPSLPIFVNESKRRACDRDRAINPQAGGHSPDKLGFPAAEFSGEGDKAPRLQQTSEPLPQQNGIFNTVRTYGNHDSYLIMVLMRSMRETMPTSRFPSTTGRAWSFLLVMRSATSLTGVSGVTISAVSV